MSRCCVIGGAGFIGRHVTRLLLRSGREVVVLGRSKQAATPLSTGAQYVCGDYADEAALRKVLAGCSEVIDLAYSTVPQTSFADPVFDIVSNLPASVGLMKTAMHMGISKLLFVSSGGTVYGSPQHLPIDEEHPTRPVSPYGITKLTLENYGRMFHDIAELPIIIVRPGNAYGEEQRPFAGQGFIATAVHSILQAKEITLFGAQGTIRDYLHVEDIASGIVAALDDGKPGATYNIGSGQGSSNLDILEGLRVLADADGFSFSTRILPARRFDVTANVLDSRRLQQCSGWQATMTLAAGLERVWRHAREKK